MPPGVIVVGAHVNGLGVIRTLAARGVRTLAITTRQFDIAQYSRRIDGHVALPSLHDRPDALVELLERHATQWSGWAVIPTNDDALLALSRHHDRLSRTYRLICAPYEVTAPLVDKDLMHALAVKAGLDVPICFGDPATLVPQRRGQVYPVIVKPLRHDRLISADGVKLFLARDERELTAAASRLDALGLDGLAFEFVPGSDSEIVVYCVYVDRHGVPSPGVTVRKLRQNPPRIGGARAAEVVDEIAGLRDATLALLREAGYRGLAFAEFKRDARTGRYVFIEVNARPVLFNAILPPTGIDLVTMATADICRERPVGAAATGWRGAWIHLQADVLTTVRCWPDERLTTRSFVEPYLGPKVFAVWSVSDPRPFALQTALLARRAGRAVIATRRHETSRLRHVPAAPTHSPEPRR